MIVHVSFERRDLALALAFVPLEQAARQMGNSFVAAQAPARSPGNARPSHHQVGQRLHLLVSAGVRYLTVDSVGVLAEYLGPLGDDCLDRLTIDPQMSLHRKREGGLPQFVAPSGRIRLAWHGSRVWWPQCGYRFSCQRTKRAQLAPDDAVEAARAAIACHGR